VEHAHSGAARALDLVAGTVAAILAAPLIGLAALALRLAGSRRVLSRRLRVGEGGHEFRAVIFNASESSSAGRLIRRSRVVGLPQIWNLLRGEMTLVGPRPQRPQMVAELELAVPLYDRRDLTRPGVARWAHERRVLAAVRGS
jgi:lipopolysaccharide/colanic/teichoic acid biosynthesis glycosyltransferase